ncbi:MAG: ABC transporter permease [Planctomycetes bacterium]|nr:ABC transporter permease [Planctomycetota bacterium]
MTPTVAASGIILLAWAVISYPQLVNPFFVPTPTAVFGSLLDVVGSAAGVRDVLNTTLRWLAGFFIGAGIGVGLGVALGLSRRTFDALEAILDFARSIPPVALLPLFLLVFGIGHSSKVAVAAWTAALPTVIGAGYAVRHARETRLLLGRALRASRLQLYTMFVLPEALPEILSTLRVSLSLALIAAVAAEMLLGGDTGLGKRIFESAIIYDTAQLYAGIVLVGGLGFVANKIVGQLDRRFVHWAGR